MLRDNFYKVYNEIKSDKEVIHISTDVEDIRRIYFYIRNLSWNHQGKDLVIVELGTCFGVTTTLMSQALLDGYDGDCSKYKIISVDIDEERSDFGRSLSDKYGLGVNVEYITGDAIILADQLSKQYHVKLWYVDDLHRENHVINELSIIDNNSILGDIIICHDYRPDTLDGEEVIRGFNKWYSGKSDRWSIPSFSCGCLIWTQRM